LSRIREEFYEFITYSKHCLHGERLRLFDFKKAAIKHYFQIILLTHHSTPSHLCVELEDFLNILKLFVFIVFVRPLFSMFLSDLFDTSVGVRAWSVIKGYRQDLKKKDLRSCYHTLRMQHHHPGCLPC